MGNEKCSTVDEYIADAQEDRRAKLQEIRSLILEAAPDAKEGIGQRMPSYKLDGRQLAYFANGKNHVSFFVDSGIVADNMDRLEGYVTCNSGFQIKPDEPLPEDLMKDFLALKIEQIKGAAK